MLTANDIEEKIVARIMELLAADKRPKDPGTLRSARIGYLSLDSLDLLTLAMQVEDDIGRPVEVEEFDESLRISELALKLSAAAE